LSTGSLRPRHLPAPFPERKDLRILIARPVSLGLKPSQAELAKLTDSTLSHINKIETGKYNPSLDILLKLAEALQVSLDELVAKNGTGEVRIEDQNFAERVKLLNSMTEEERKAVTLIIDAILTRKKMAGVLKEAAGA